jgi:hypothetical protein
MIFVEEQGIAGNLADPTHAFWRARVRIDVKVREVAGRDVEADAVTALEEV